MSDYLEGKLAETVKKLDSLLATIERKKAKGESADRDENMFAGLLRQYEALYDAVHGG